MPQNFCRSFFDIPRLLIRTRLRDCISESLCEARNDSGIIFCKVVQLDRFVDAVILFCMTSGTNEDLVAELLGIGEV